MFVVGVVLFVTVVPYFAVLLIAGGYANIVLVTGVALVLIGWGHLCFFWELYWMLQSCWLY